MISHFKRSFLCAFLALGLGGKAIAQETVECVNPKSGLTEFRIINGQNAEPSDWPFIVQLQTPTGFGYCGGSLITQDWVLTAGHCFQEDMEVTVHRVDSRGRAQGPGAKVIKTIVHPDFGEVDGSLVNDMMLLKLDHRMSIPNSQLALIPTAKMEATLADLRTCAEVAGWGVQAEDGDIAEFLAKVNVRQLRTSLCKNAYGAGISAPIHVCAGYEQGGKDSCQGDSGGPLIIRDGPTGFLLIGVVSFGIGCARAGYPGVYGRTSTYRDWIFQTVENN